MIIYLNYHTEVSTDVIIRHETKIELNIRFVGGIPY